MTHNDMPSAEELEALADILDQDEYEELEMPEHLAARFEHCRAVPSIHPEAPPEVPVAAPLRWGPLLVAASIGLLLGAALMRAMTPPPQAAKTAPAVLPEPATDEADKPTVQMATTAQAGLAAADRARLATAMKQSEERADEARQWRAKYWRVVAESGAEKETLIAKLSTAEQERAMFEQKGAALEEDRNKLEDAIVASRARYDDLAQRSEAENARSAERIEALKMERDALRKERDDAQARLEELERSIAAAAAPNDGPPPSP